MGIVNQVGAGDPIGFFSIDQEMRKRSKLNGTSRGDNPKDSVLETKRNTMFMKRDERKSATF